MIKKYLMGLLVMGLSFFGLPQVLLMVPYEYATPLLVLTLVVAAAILWWATWCDAQVAENNRKIEQIDRKLAGLK